MATVSLRLLAVWIAALSCLPATTSTALAQKETFTFDCGLSRLAKERRLFIAIEGSPLKGDAHPAEVSRILNSDSPTTDKVQEIATLFDYMVKPNGNIYLLNKKYTSLDDLPCVTQEEVEDFVRNLDEMCVTYAPSYRDFAQRNKMRSQIMVGILDSLDPTQKRIAFAGGIPIRQLENTQRTKFESWAQSDVAGDLSEASDLFQSLFGNSSDAQLTIAAGLDGRQGVVFRNRSKQGRATALWDDSGRRSPAGSPRPGGSLPAVPHSCLTPPTEFLSEIVGRIAKGEKFRASAEVADKPVTVTGMENVTARQALDALARLYDLRVVKRTGETVIGRRTIRPSGFNRLALDIQATVPLPLRGLLFRPLRNASRRTPPAPSDCGQRAALYTQALRTDIQQSKNREIAFVSLSPRARAAIALFFLTIGSGTDVLDSLVTAARRAALFESEADRLTIRYRQPDDQNLDFEVGYNFSGAGGSYGYHGIGGGGPLYRQPQN